MSFEIFQESRLGQRKNNEDRVGYCYSKNSVLMVVADGMGGYEHGEIASQITLQTLTDVFRQKVLKGFRDPRAFLLDGILTAHRAITEYALDRFTEFPRSTVVVCLIHDDKAYWAHAGDSRLYVLRNGQIFFKTKDHCRVNDLLEAGQITAEEAHNHPDRNKIYSCLGGTITPIITISDPLTMKAGDIILLATDGLWGNIDDITLINSFGAPAFKDSMASLLDKAERAGGKYCDNLSTVALLWGGEISENSITPEDLAGNEVKMEKADPYAQAVAEVEESTGDAPPEVAREIEDAFADLRAVLEKNQPRKPKKNTKIFYPRR